MDKIDQLLDAIEHPERHSDSELEAMLRDSEIKSAFDMLGKTKSSLQPIATPDVDAEWKAFDKRHKASPLALFGRLMPFSRNAAASIAVVIASVVAVAAVVGVGVNYVISKNAQTSITEPAEAANVTEIRQDTAAVAEEINVAVPETILFDNETLENIISRIRAYYGYQTEFNAGAPKTLRLYFRWNQALPVEEVVESLNNFEQIRLTIGDKTIKID